MDCLSSNCQSTMSKKKKRELPTRDTKILRALSCGFCMYDFQWESCSEKILLEKSSWEITTFWEQAHILPYSENNWPRGVWGQTIDSYRNRLLLCPNHHSIIDKDVEQYSEEVLRTMRFTAETRYKLNRKTRSENILQFSKTPLISAEYYFFSEKVSYLFKTVNSATLISEKKNVIKLLNESYILLWHFIRNSEWDNWIKFLWIEEIKNLIIKYHDHPSIWYIIANHVQNESKDLLEIYLQIIVSFDSIEGLMRAILSSLKTKNFEKLQTRTILEKIIQSKSSEHPFVKTDLLEAMGSIIDEDNIWFIIQTIWRALWSNTSKDNINIWWPALSLVFQAKDANNQVFWQALYLLWLIAGNIKLYQYGMNSLVALLIEELIPEEKNWKKRSIAWIYLDDRIYDDVEDGYWSHHLRYEYEPKKRYKWEILRWLEQLHLQKKHMIVEKILKNLLVTKRQTLITLAIEFVNKNITDYKLFAEKIILNKNIRKVFPIRDRYLQKLIESYFLKYHNPFFSKFLDSVFSLKDKESQIRLLASIPEKKRTKKITDLLMWLSKELSTYIEPRKHISFTSWSWRSSKDLLLGLKYREIVLKLSSQNSLWRMDLYELCDDVAKFIGEDINVWLKLLDDLEELSPYKEVVERIIEHICNIITNKQDSVEEKLYMIITLHDKSSKYSNDSNSVIRILNGLCRNEDIIKIQQNNLELYEKLKTIVFSYLKHSSPSEDYWFFDKQVDRYDNWIQVAINSVRWVAAEVLIVLYHFNPSDIEIRRKITEASNDVTVAVRANLIFNLIYLITKDYELCETIVNCYKDERITSIDFSLSHYFYRLWSTKLKDVRGIVKNIVMYSQNSDVQENIWRLLWIVWCEAIVWYDDMINDIVSLKVGTDNTRWGFVWALLESLNKALKDEDTKTIEYITSTIVKLLENEGKAKKSDIEVINHLATYFLRRKDLWALWFSKLYSIWFIEKLLRLLPTYIEFHQYIIQCMKDIVKEWDQLKEIIKILHYQSVNSTPIFWDSLIANNVKDIIELYLDNYTNTDKESMKLIITVFDKWLELWFDSFYDLYHKFFASGIIDLSEFKY